MLTGITPHVLFHSLDMSTN